MTEKCWKNIAKDAAFEDGRWVWELKYADVEGFGFRV